jgi:hypothetical protein
MANTFFKIASATAGSGGVANFSFTSIPQTYTDLAVVLSGRIAYASNAAGLYINFNGDFTSGNYVRLYLSGDGTNSSSTVYGAVIALGNMPANTATSNTFGSVTAYIPNYTSSNQKSVSVDSVAENNAIATSMNLTANSWSGTSAINQMIIYSDGGNLVQYSMATLYGVVNS